MAVYQSRYLSFFYFKRVFFFFGGGGGEGGGGANFSFFCMGQVLLLLYFSEFE